MGNSNLFDSGLKPHAIALMKSFLRFYLEYSSKQPGSMTVTAAAEANGLLEALEDSTTPENVIVENYRIVVRCIVEAQTAESMLLIPLAVSAEKPHD